MKKYVICKTCGYVMEAGKLEDVCPACGVTAKAFEPYKPRLTRKRLKILSLHLHPIILHFPQAVVVFALLLLLLIPFSTGPLNEFITMSAKFNTYILPLCIIGGTLSGILDGKIRFKSAVTPILKFKIILSCAFFILSLAAALILANLPLSTPVLISLIIIMSLCTVCAVVLGRIGSALSEAVYPG